MVGCGEGVMYFTSPGRPTDIGLQLGRPAILVAGKGSLFVCVEVLRPRQPNGVMSSAVSLPNHTFTGQA